MLNARTRYYFVRGLRLAYHEYGEPDGRPLLCIHGFLDHGPSFRFMADHLRGFRVVAPDMRGHGHSGWVGPGGYYHFYDYFDDCRALLDELGWSSFGLVGHSMGGSIATAVAALEPSKVESVVLFEGLGPSFGDLSGSVGRIERWSSELRKRDLNAGPAQRAWKRRVMADIEDAARRLKALNGRLSDERARALATTLTEPMAGGVVWRYDPLHRTPAVKPFLQGEAEALWSAIKAPVLAIQGSESWWPVEGLSDRLHHFENAVSATMPDTGHNLHHDRPDLVAAAVTSWFERPGERPSGLLIG